MVEILAKAEYRYPSPKYAPSLTADICEKSQVDIILPRDTCCFPTESVASFLLETKMADLKEKTGVRQGTLALMMLRTLHVLGLHLDYRNARRIEQISGELLEDLT